MFRKAVTVGELENFSNRIFVEFKPQLATRAFTFLKNEQDTLILKVKSDPSQDNINALSCAIISLFNRCFKTDIKNLGPIIRLYQNVDAVLENNIKTTNGTPTIVVHDLQTYMNMLIRSFHEKSLTESYTAFLSKINLSKTSAIEQLAQLIKKARIDLGMDAPPVKLEAGDMEMKQLPVRKAN